MGNMADNIKPLLAVSIVGHVDSGKSTLTGTLACKLGGLDGRQMQKLQADADSRNKGSFAKAFFTDRTEEEKNRGVTIQTTLVPMETDKFRLTIIDCPGHVDYIKNATSGCKQADVSIVVCPARFEASCSAEGTLKTHLTLCAVLGSKKFIVCINKLDEVAITNENSLETAFDAACAAVMNLLKKLGVSKEDVIFLPISALKEIGVFKDCETYDFYKGSPVKDKENEGQTKYIKTVEDAINYQDVPLRALERPLRMPISSIANVKGQGVVFCGRVDYGLIKKGTPVKVLPIGVESAIKSIEAYNKAVEVAEAGANVGFLLETKDKQVIEKVKVGSLVGPQKDPNFVVSPFYKVSAISMKKTKASASEATGIKPGYSPVISCGSANIPCNFGKILSVTTKDKEKIENPTVIPAGARFEAIIYPKKQVVFETAKEFPGLGKFVCRDSGILVVAGQITGKLTLEEGKELGLDVALLSGDKEAIKKMRAANKK